MSVADVGKIARPGSTDTLSIDEGFVDLQTPVAESECGATPGQYVFSIIMMIITIQIIMFIV